MREFALVLTEQDVEIIGSVLLELPGRVCIPLIEKINAQLAEQQKSQPEDVSPDGKVE